MTLIEDLKKKADLLEKKKDFNGSLEKYNELEKISIESGDKENLLFSKQNQAWIIWKNLGDHEKAFNLYVEVEELSREIGNKRSLMVSLQNQSIMLYDNHQDYEAALNKLIETEKLSMELEDDEYQASSLALQTHCYIQLGNADKSFSKSKECLALSKRQNNKLHTAAFLMQHASILKEMHKNFNEALLVYEEAEPLLLEIGDQESYFSCLGEQADILLYELNQYEPAYIKSQELGRLAAKSEDKVMLEYALRLQAKSLLKLKKADEAYKKYDELILLCEELDIKNVKAFGLIEQGYLLLNFYDDYNKALLKYQEAESLSKAVNAKGHLFDSLRNQGDILELKLHKYEEALIKYQEAEKVAMELGAKNQLMYCLRKQGILLGDNLSKYDEALGKYLEFEALSAKVGSKKDLIQAQESIAWIYWDIKEDYEKAFGKYQEIEELARELNAKEYLCLSLKQQAEFLIIEADLQEAGFEKAKELEIVSRELNNKISTSWALCFQGDSLRCQEKWMEAMSKYEQCISMCQGLEDKSSGKLIIFQCYSGQAHIYRSDGEERYSKALLKCQEAEKIAVELNEKYHLLSNLANMAETLNTYLEEYGKALIKYDEYDALLIELGADYKNAWHLNNHAWILMEKSGDYEAAFAKYQQAEELARKIGDNKELKTSLKNQVTILRLWGDWQTAKTKKKELKSVK